MPQSLVLASHNSAKLSELRALFKPYQVKLINLEQIDTHEIEETGLSFVENAILKARYACQVTGMAAIADDSGLEVAALNGQPGIYSARFSGACANDASNNLHLLTQLSTTPLGQRQANYRCVMVYMKDAKDPAPIIAQGQLNGVILETPIGDNGFGYDPLFYVEELNASAAQLSKLQKNQISHRAKASRALIQKLIEFNVFSNVPTV